MYQLTVNGTVIPLSAFAVGPMDHQLSASLPYGDDATLRVCASIFGGDAPLHERLAIDAWIVRDRASPHFAQPVELDVNIVLTDGDADTLLVGATPARDVWPGCGIRGHAGERHRLLGSIASVMDDEDEEPVSLSGGVVPPHPHRDFLRWYFTRGRAPLDASPPGGVIEAIVDAMKREDWRDTTPRTGAQGSPRQIWTDYLPALAFFVGVDEEDVAFAPIARWLDDQLDLRSYHWDGSQFEPDEKFPGYAYERRQGNSQVTAYDAQHWTSTRAPLIAALIGDPVAFYEVECLLETARRYCVGGGFDNEVNARAFGWFCQGVEILTRFAVGSSLASAALSAMAEAFANRPEQSRFAPYPSFTVNTNAQERAKDHRYMGTSLWMSATVGVGAVYGGAADDRHDDGSHWLREALSVTLAQIDLGYMLSEDEDGTCPNNLELVDWQGPDPVTPEATNVWRSPPRFVVYHHRHAQGHVLDFGTYMTHAAVRFLDLLARPDVPYVAERLRTWGLRTPLLEYADKNADFGFILRMAPLLETIDKPDGYHP